MWGFIVDLSVICSIIGIPFSYYIYRKTKIIEKKLSNIDAVKVTKFAFNKKNFIDQLKAYKKLFNDGINNKSSVDLIGTLETLKHYPEIIDFECMKKIDETIRMLENEELFNTNKVLVNISRIASYLENDIETEFLIKRGER